MNDSHLQAQVTVAKPPEEVYAAIADITQMGRWSPECTGGRWLGKQKAAVPGARFVGFNKRKRLRWATLCKVVEAEPGKRFAFSVSPSEAVWRYQFEPSADGGTIITETRDMQGEPWVVRLADRFFLGGHHQEELAEGMQRTLERIKAELER